MELPVPDDEESPWAMQFAVRAEKMAPPSHSAVCEAVAMAVVRLLNEPREEWREAVHRWESGSIRKVIRRARGARWRDVQRLPGISIEHAGAQVRAFVPRPVADVPPEVAKLQVAGLDLPDGRDVGGDRPADEDLKDDRAGAPPDPPYAAIAINPDVRMSTGKAAAQSGHAAHLLLRQIAEPERSAWIAAGLRVHLVRGEATSRRGWRRCVRHATVAVRDAGFTEVPPGTLTAIAWFVYG